MKKCIASFRMEVFADTKEQALRIVRRKLRMGSGSGLSLVEMAAKTERCDICRMTYIPSEVSEINGEKLCVYCRFDKYGIEELREEDIPF